MINENIEIRKSVTTKKNVNISQYEVATETATCETSTSGTYENFKSVEIAEERRALSVNNQQDLAANRLSKRYENTTPSIAINVCANIHLNKSTL